MSTAPKLDKATLCKSCTLGTVRTDSRGITSVYCSDTRNYMRREILSCTAYEERNGMQLWQYKEIAWSLKTDKNRGPMGFFPPGKENYSEVS